MRDIVHLEDYRGRRRRRLRRAVALCQADPDRARLIRILEESVSLLSADRAAVLWVDEYGSGLVHVHTILDLVSDQPRREFALAPLRSAWNDGVPGVFDVPDVARRDAIVLPGHPRSFCAVALGSDGMRSWFLVADARSPRPPLEDERADGLLFLAGECSAVVLHQDLVDEKRRRKRESFERLRRERFSGWPVLRDVEEQEADDPVEDARITCRFLVSRLLRTLVDDDFHVADEILAPQITGVRQEFGRNEVAEDPERPYWEAVVKAAEADDRTALGNAAVALGDRVEWQGHLHGARELYRLAYDVALVAGASETAVEAARFVGRACRKLSDWEDAFHWYEVAGGIASEEGLKAKRAAVLDGLGNTYRERGNFPRAREMYEEVLRLGRKLDDRTVLGKAHQNLAILEKHSGRTDEAIRRAWSAVGAYDADRWKVRALADLAGIFLESGELDGAEDAYEIVAARTKQADVHAVSLEALAHIAALRGDRREFRKRLARADKLSSGELGVAVRADILLYRGRSYLALGERRLARECLEEVRSESTRHEIHRVSFEAEQLLEEGRRESNQVHDDLDLPALPPATKATIVEVRGPLAEMKRCEVGAGAG